MFQKAWQATELESADSRQSTDTVIRTDTMLVNADHAVFMWVNMIMDVFGSIIVVFV